MTDSLAAQFLAHAVVVLEHHAVGGQVKLGIVQCMLAEAHTLILVHDAAHLHHLALRQAQLVLVPDHLGRRRRSVHSLHHVQLIVGDALDAPHEGDSAPHELVQVHGAHEGMRLPVHILHFFGHGFISFYLFYIIAFWCGIQFKTKVLLAVNIYNWTERSFY